MVIGFDGKRAVRNFTGLGNYSRLVIEHTARLMPDTRMLVYSPDMRANPRLDPLRRLDNVEFRLPPPQGFKGALWRSYGMTNNLAADRVDIYHGLSNELPLNIRSAGVKSVVTIHDLIYRTMPQCYSFVDRRLYDFKYRRACVNADRIVAISECTRRDIISHYGIPEDKITVIYQGCDDIFRQDITPEMIGELRMRHNLPARYIVQVGTVELRKNLELTVRALPHLPADVALVAVGRDRNGYRRYVEAVARSLGAGDRIVWLSGLPFHDLPALYAGSLAAVNPSRYEGFGIPVLEALETFTPVVAATGSCLEEAGGPGSLYVSPDSPHDMAAAISAIISGSIDIKAMKAVGKRHAARFSTTAMAGALNDLYRSLAAEG